MATRASKPADTAEQPATPAETRQDTGTPPPVEGSRTTLGDAPFEQTAATDVHAVTGLALLGWHFAREINEALSRDEVTVDVHGVPCRALEVTADGKLKVERTDVAGPGFAPQPLTQPLIEQLLEGRIAEEETRL